MTGIRSQSFSEFPQYAPEVQRIKDKVAAEGAKLPNEAIESSPSLLSDLSRTIHYAGFAGRTRAVKEEILNKEIGTKRRGLRKYVLLFDRKAAQGSLQEQLSVKLKSFTRKGKAKELENIKTAMKICQKFNDDPHSVSKDEFDQLKNLKKSLTNYPNVMNELENTIKTLETRVSISKAVLNSMLENNAIGEDFSCSGIGQMAAQELLEDRCQELQEDISRVSVGDILKLNADVNKLSEQGAFPEGFTIKENLDSIAQAFVLNQCQNFQKDIGKVSADDILQLESKLSDDCEKLKELLPKNFSFEQGLEDIAQEFFTRRASLAYLLKPGKNAVPKSIWDTPANDVHQLINQLTADSEKLKTVLPQDFSIQTYAENLTQDYFEARCDILRTAIHTHSAEEMLECITELQAGTKELEELTSISTLIDVQKNLEDIAQSFISNQCQELKENIQWASADKILGLESKVRSDIRVFNKFLPEGLSISDDLSDISQAYIKYRFQNFESIDDLAQLASDHNQLTRFLPQDFSIPTHVENATQSYLQMKCDTLQEAINAHSPDEIRQEIRQLRSDIETLKELASASTLTDTQVKLRTAIQSFINNQCQNPKIIDDVLQLASDYKQLNSFLPKDFSLQDAQQQAAQSYFDNMRQNPPTASRVSQLKSDSEQLNSFLPEDFSLQDVQQQAAKSYFDHTWQSTCEELLTNTIDTQKLEEALGVLQEYAPDITISEAITEDMKTTLSWAIQSACQNVQKAEEDFEVASKNYAELPEENLEYDDLNAIGIYDSTPETAKLSFTSFVGNALLELSLVDINESDPNEIANNIAQHSNQLQNALDNLNETLKDVGGTGVLPESLETAAKDINTALETLKNALQSETSANLEKSFKNVENAYKKLDKIAEPAIDEAFEKCAETRANEASKRAKEESNKKAENQSKRELIQSSFESSRLDLDMNNRESLEVTCRNLAKFLPQDDPALDEVEKLVPGFKERLNTPQNDYSSTGTTDYRDLPPHSEGLGDLPPPVPSEENLAFARALEEGPDSQAMKDWEAKYDGNIALNYSDLPPPPEGLDDLPPPPEGLDDLPPPPEGLNDLPPPLR